MHDERGGLGPTELKHLRAGLEKCLGQTRHGGRFNREPAPNKNLTVHSIWFNLTIFNYRGYVVNTKSNIELVP